MGDALRCCWLAPPQEAEVFVNGVSLGRTGDLSKPPSGGCEAYLLYRSFAVPAGVLSASRPNVVAVRDPIRDRIVFLQALAHLFGFSAAVNNFYRVVAFVVAVARRTLFARDITLTPVYCKP